MNLINMTGSRKKRNEQQCTGKDGKKPYLPMLPRDEIEVKLTHKRGQYNSYI